MAKQLVNPLERHVEKAVLGLAGLALIGSIATYVIRTPNRTELGGEAVTPGNIDEKIGQKAKEVSDRMRSAKAEPKIPEPLADKFAETLKPLKAAPLPLVVALRPDVPRVDVGGPTGGPAGLAKVLQPAKPAITTGRGTFITQDAAGATKLIPADWVSVSAIWNIKEQRESQIKEYGSANADLVLGPPQIQRRTQRADGTWSDDDWQDVEATPAVKLPREPAIRIVLDGKKMIVDRDTLKDLEKFRSELVHPTMQLDCLRPMPPDMNKPTRWELPLITTYRDVLVQDDEYLFPAEAPATEPADRYGLSDAPKKVVNRELTPAEHRAKAIEEGYVLLEAAKKNQIPGDAVRAYNKAMEVIADRTASPAEKDKAEKLKKDATQAETDIKRALALGGGAQPGGQPAGGQAERPKREKLPKQQVWAHDARINSLSSGGTYQYRMRFQMLNVFAGAPNKFEKPENAAVLMIAGDWSEPSDPVSIAPSYEFYVTGEDTKDKQVSLDFFQWNLGVWLKPDRKMKIGIGQSLSDRQRVKAPGLDDPNVVETPEVEFAADAVVVDVDLDRALRERKGGSTPTGVRFGAPVASTAAVLVDSKGHLVERFVQVDKMHPGKRDATGRLWTPKK